MRNSDVEKIFLAGMEFGIVNTLGCMRRPRVGFGIGGPESAGAANLYVGWEELVHFERQSMRVRWQLTRKVFRKRWQDDLNHVWEHDIDRETRIALEQRQHVKFYGGELELEEEIGQDEAFGYKWNVAQGVLLCRSLNKFEVESYEETTMMRTRPLLAGAAQYL